MNTKRNALKSLATASVVALGLLGALGSGLAQAQTKLKWAHVYETSEAYHTESVWAADEIKSAPTANLKFKSSQLPPWAKKPTSTKA